MQLAEVHHYHDLRKMCDYLQHFFYAAQSEFGNLVPKQRQVDAKFAFKLGKFVNL